MINQLEKSIAKIICDDLGKNVIGGTLLNRNFMEIIELEVV